MEGPAGSCRRIYLNAERAGIKTKNALSLSHHPLITVCKHGTVLKHTARYLPASPKLNSRKLSIIDHPIDC